MEHRITIKSQKEAKLITEFKSWYHSFVGTDENYQKKLLEWAERFDEMDLILDSSVLQANPARKNLRRKTF
ncbi:MULTISPECIES: hypothetical protein [Enterococcus]|uniref:hypothetical protein n=1 Tax=Enterococcus TaxID=1350 RepID=UPI00065E49AB|nr:MULTISPECIES: hypothetical protein [Enterococcus]KAF1300839.1 hypothetical protein BAU16_11670 [Enterococcus sp. JM9B]